MRRAKKKLNAAYVTGALIVAAVVGAMFESWTVFAITGSVLIASAVYSGDIRR